LPRSITRDILNEDISEASNQIMTGDTIYIRTTTTTTTTTTRAQPVACIPTKWHLDPFSRLATTDIDRKLGAVPL